MSRHPVIVAACGVIILLLLWMLLRRHEPQNIEKSLHHAAPVAVVTNQPPHASRGERDKQYLQQKIEAIRAIVKEGNVPIEFLGQVVDQENHPIEGVKVKAHSRETYEEEPGRAGTKWPTMEIMTDSDGMFRISGLRGDVLGIDSIEKDGYELTKKGELSFSYHSGEIGRSYVPDLSKPVIYRMWKKGETEPLIAHKVEQRIPYDGTPVLFDLATGKEVNSGGDLRVTLMRNPQVIRWGDRNYEWKATFEAVGGGGLIESKDDFMYRAPESGYEPKIEIETKPGNPNWAMEKRIAFYLKSRGGQNYARVVLDLMTGSDKPKTGFSFESYLNPSGSRNLEYDPAKEIKPERIRAVGLEKALEEVKAGKK